MIGYPDDTSSKKRTRTDLGSDEFSPVTQSESIWFDDGNIVIETERVQFRVHRSILSKHSKIFADMFGLAESQHINVDGVPVVHLADSSQELGYILEWMYEPK